LADNTTSALYPGKLVFLLPLAFAAKYKLYVTAHLLLAAASTYWLARQWAAGVLAAGIAALSYSMSGSVVFQYCNVVFLVGAAWLPVSLYLADRMLRSRRLIDCLWFGAVLALMTLGGDPQTAYHSGLCAAAYAGILWLSERRRLSGRGQPAAASPALSCAPVAGRLGWLRFAQAMGRHRATLLLQAAWFGALLAAVQVLPSTRWTWHSHRAAHQWPRSIYEIPAFLSRVPQGPPPTTRPAVPQGRNRSYLTGGIVKGCLGRPDPDSHQANALQFSVGPWRWAELFWPNVGGRQFPVHRRWMEIIPAEGRIWTPTLYMGLLPALVGLGALQFRLRNPRVAWLSWMFVLGMAGSLGAYGIGWLTDQLRWVVWGDVAGRTWLGPQVGGLYWLMTLLLPGYALFRYPAKLLVMATLALSLLAALGWDRAWSERAGRMRRSMAGLGVASLLAAGLVLAACWPIRKLLQYVPPDRLFGPLDVTGAWIDLLTALVHTAVVCSLLGWFWRRGEHGHPLVWQCLTVLVCAAELTVAQRWLVPGAPESIWQQEPSTAQAIRQDRRRRSLADGFRVFRASAAGWRPAAWQSTSSPGRQVEGLRWDRDTLLPRHHLTTDLAVVESRSPFRAADFQQFLNVARQHGTQRSDGVREPCRELLDALAAQYLALPQGFRLEGTVEVDLPEASEDAHHARLWYNPHHLPRAWIVRHVQRLPELGTADPAWVAHRTMQVLVPDGRPRDLCHRAVVESDVDFRQATHVQSLRSEVLVLRDRCRLVRDDPQRVEIDVALTDPGLVVLSDLFYPGWAAWVSDPRDLSTSCAVPILRTNRVLRGVYLPAGRFRLVFRYRPWEFYAGAAISFASWLAVGGLAGVVVWNRRHRRPTRERS
jgi:hypothetical protein